ncbi:MAG: transposase family protein [Myxococcales bacterium]|nr:transposase family protein [Myxococcales bacterium]
MLGMALLRDAPITVVARTLELALPALDGIHTVASSALTQARGRLGDEPMEWLFLRSSEQWATANADKDRWRDLALYAVDGSTLRVADSVENRDQFGSAKTGPHQGGRHERVGGYPLMRIVVLMAPGSHLLATAACGPYGTDERGYTRSLWGSVPDR